MILDDIILVYSGGSNNSNANLSIGGDPSGFPVLTTVNNLFGNVTDEETDTGKIDYRCIYIFNNISNSLYNIKIYIVDQNDVGSTIQLGISKSTEIQRISIVGIPLGGSFTISYSGSNVIVPFDANVATWATNLQTGLNDLSDLSGVVVSASVSTNLVVFEVKFEGYDDFKSHEMIELVANNLGNSPSISISELVTGSPINSIAPDIEFDTVVPFGVSFIDTSKESPITLNILRTEEGFPLWFKRTTLPGTAAMLNDNCVLRVSVSPIP